MFCRYCGNELPDDAQFCNCCGKPVDAGQPKQEVLSEQPYEEIPSEEASVASDKEPTPTKALTPREAKRVKIIFCVAVAIVTICVIAGKMLAPKQATDAERDAYIDSVINGSVTTGKTAEDVLKEQEKQEAVQQREAEEEAERQAAIEAAQQTETDARAILTKYDYTMDIAYAKNECAKNSFNFADDFGGKRVLLRGRLRNMDDTWIEHDRYLVMECFDDEYHFDFSVACYLTDQLEDPEIRRLFVGCDFRIIGTIEYGSVSKSSMHLTDCLLYDVDPDNYEDENDEEAYGNYEELTDNSPNLPVNLSEPYGYYEKADGPGGFSVEYISDDGTTRIEYYTDGQPGYYGRQWFDYDFSMSIAITIDFSSDNVLDITDGNGNILISLVASDNYITLTAPKDLYGVPTSRINGDYYCKIQSSILQ